MARSTRIALLAGSIILSLVLGSVLIPYRVTPVAPAQTGSDDALPSQAPSDQPLEAATDAVTTVQARVLEKDFRPASLAGTDEDGQLVIAEDGTLKRSRGLRDRLDYWLTALGELPLEAIRLRLIHEAQVAGGDRAATDMATLFDAYVAYRHAARNVLSAQPSPAAHSERETIIQAIEEGFNTLHSLRISYLGPETAEAFFANEEAYANFSVEALRIRTDPDLTPQARLTHLKQAAERLPESVKRQVEAQFEQTTRLDAGLQAMHSARNEYELEKRLEDAGYPPEARLRAVQAWREEQAFKHAYERYRAAAATATRDLPEPQRTQRLEQLRTRYFKSAQFRQWAQLRDTFNPG